MAGNLNPYIDLTGTKNQQQINQEDIRELIEKYNQMQEQVESLTGALNIVGYGSKLYSWNGTVPASPGYLQDYLYIPVNINSSVFLLAFFSRSDIPNRIYNLPYEELLVNGNNDGVIIKSFVAGADYGAGQLYVNIQFYIADAPIDFTFYYYLIQQPANVK